MGAPNGFFDKVRKVMEASPGTLFDVAAINRALGEDAPEKVQPIYNALHELTKTGEIRRIKKTGGKGSNYYWPPNAPDEPHSFADSGTATNKPKARAPKYDCPPALTQAVNAMRTQKPVSHPAKTVLDCDPGTRSASFTRAPQPALAPQEKGYNYRDFVAEPPLGYIARWKQSGDTENLRKARHFIDLLIEHEESVQ